MGLAAEGLKGEGLVEEEGGDDRRGFLLAGEAEVVGPPTITTIRNRRVQIRSLTDEEQDGGGGIKGEGRGGRRGRERDGPLLGDLTAEEEVVAGPDSSTSILSLSSFGLAGAQAQSPS